MDFEPVMFDPSRHIIRNESAWLRAMRVQTGREDLGLYRHRITQNWVLYTLRDGIFLDEMVCMPACPDQMRVVVDMDGDPITADDIRWALRPAILVAEEKAASAKAEWRAARRAVEDREREIQKRQGEIDRGRIVSGTH